MKFQTTRDQLLGPLSLVASVVERRQTLPILANVFLKAENDTLLLVGTDLEVEIEIALQVEKATAGAGTITARKFLDICRTLPEAATMKFSLEEGKAKIQSGRSRFSVQVLAAEDFPRLETDGWEERIKVGQSALRALLDKTAFSMAQQDVRYFLNGVLLELGGSDLVAVATDGHRLARSATPLGTEVENPRQAIIPRKAVQELTRFLNDSEDEITIELNPNHVRFSRASAALTTKLIDGKFPDYRAVMAQNLTQTMTANRNELHEVLARTAVLTNEKYRGVRLELQEGGIKVTAHNPDQEEASDEVAVEYGGTEIDIGFNVSYLMEALRALSTETVEIKLQDGNSGCLLHSPNDNATQYLVMPMRL